VCVCERVCGCYSNVNDDDTILNNIIMINSVWQINILLFLLLLFPVMTIIMDAWIASVLEAKRFVRTRTTMTVSAGVSKLKCIDEKMKDWAIAPKHLPAEHVEETCPTPARALQTHQILRIRYKSRAFELHLAFSRGQLAIWRLLSIASMIILLRLQK